MRETGHVEIESVLLDDPKAGEVLVRTAAAGLCHSDLHFLSGTFPIRTPLIMGHEAAGVVEAVGEGVTSIAVGDPVVACLSQFCGHCEFCLSGRPSLCGRQGLERPRGEPPRATLQGERCGQFASIGAFAEAMLVHEHALVVVPTAMPLDRAALLGCAVTTGVGAVLQTAGVESGTTVAVMGCGGVGLNCVQAAAIAGARRIIAIDTNPDKLGLAVRFGATDTIDASQHDPVEQVRNMLPAPGRGGFSPPGGVDYAFEAIGRKETVEQSFAMLRRGGTATVVGMLSPGQMIELPGLEFQDEKRIQGSQMGSNRFRIDIPRYVELYFKRRLLLDELVSVRISLEEIAAGFAALANGNVARSVVTFA
jgi:S-(hydroxymethyl)glutathione dehydrogenase / alcohol dehydrogenase